MNDDDRLNLRQRQALDDRARRYHPPHTGDWFWFIVPILVCLAIIGVGYCLMGCAAHDAALVKDIQTRLDATVQPIVAGIAKVDSYTSGIKTKMDNIREANVNGRDQINSNFDKWAIYLLILLPFVSYIGPKIAWVAGQKAVSGVSHRKKKVTVSE